MYSHATYSNGGYIMVKINLIDKLAKQLKISRTKAHKIVDTVLKEIKHGLVLDGIVTLRGFGSFRTRNKTERIGRNPKTGEQAVISARRVPSFKASKLLKNKVNG